MILLIYDSSMRLSEQETNKNSLKCIRRSRLNIPNHLPPTDISVREKWWSWMSTLMSNIIFQYHNM